MWHIKSLKIAVSLRQIDRIAGGVLLAAGKMFFLVDSTPDRFEILSAGVLLPLDREERHGFWSARNAITEGLDYSIVPGNFPIVNISLPGTLWVGFNYVYCPKKRAIFSQAGPLKQTIVLMESF